MAKIRGVLFDKDGTLIDFFSLWLAAARWAVPRFLKENGLKEELSETMFRALGVRGERVDPEGGLAYKAYGEIAEDICRALARRQALLSPAAVREQLERLFAQYAGSGEVVYRPTADLEKLLLGLKTRDIRIGLATADTMQSAESCLERLGVRDQFDYVGADDGRRRPKPEADMFLEFERRFRLLPGQILMAGDTRNDMEFAKRCGGIAVAVLSGVGRRADLENTADYILDDVGMIPELIDRLGTPG